jgi:hypothetical protein
VAAAVIDLLHARNARPGPPDACRSCGQQSPAALLSGPAVSISREAADGQDVADTDSDSGAAESADAPSLEEPIPDR